MWKVRAYTREGWRAVELAELSGQTPSTSAVLETSQRRFPNAPNFLRHLRDELEISAENRSANGNKDAIELWSSMAQEQAREFDWVLPHKIVAVDKALALYSLDSTEQYPLSLAWHDRTAVIIHLNGQEQHVTLEYESDLHDEVRIEQMRYRHASQGYRLETIFDWRGYFGYESAIIDGWTTMYRHGKKWVATVRGKTCYLVGHVLRRLTKTASTPSIKSDPLAKHRLMEMERRHGHVARLYPDLSTVDSCQHLPQAMVFVHGTASCGIQCLKDLPPNNFPYPIFRFEHDTFQPLEQNSESLVQLIEEKLSCRRLVLAAHSRGGLVAKWALQKLQRKMWHYGPYGPLINLHTFGTPHLGTPLVNMGSKLLNSLWKLGEDVVNGVPLLTPISKAYSLLANDPELPPGIQVMKEGSETLGVLNSLVDVGLISCWGGRFDENAATSGFGIGVEGFLQGALSGMDHDLVVPTSSALGCGIPQQVLTCSHVNYFSDPTVQTAIQNGLHPQLEL